MCWWEARLSHGCVKSLSTKSWRVKVLEHWNNDEFAMHIDTGKLYLDLSSMLWFAAMPVFVWIQMYMYCRQAARVEVPYTARIVYDGHGGFHVIPLICVSCTEAMNSANFDAITSTSWHYFSQPLLLNRCISTNAFHTLLLQTQDIDFVFGVTSGTHRMKKKNWGQTYLHYLRLTKLSVSLTS